MNLKTGTARYGPGGQPPRTPQRGVPTIENDALTMRVTKKIAGNERATNGRAFTLIELLTVIAVIGVLAALLFPVFGTVKKRSYLNHANAEMAQLETAIDRYKAAYGFYPPSNTNGPLLNQLYFELEGTTLTNGNFQTLDGSSTITPAEATALFYVGGFINCNGTNASAGNGPVAQNFLPELKSGQIKTYTTNPPPNVVNIIVSSVGGPDADYQPLGLQGVNPWRYNSSNPTNNPGAYDLWVQLVIGGKTNLICNWSSQVQVNSTMP